MHIVHVVYRFGVGGLENGLVKIVRNLPDDRHTVVSLTDADPVQLDKVAGACEVICMNKSPGQGFAVLAQIFALLWRLKPDVVHTRNIGTLEVQVLALFAGVRGRVHSEHGWDTYDPDGTNPRYRLLRRISDLYVKTWIALSQDLCDWLTDVVAINAQKLVRITNGVDTEAITPGDARSDNRVCFVTVTRLSDIKDPLNAVRGFLQMCDVAAPDQQLHLTVVGDGPLMAGLKQLLVEHPHGERVSLVGQQADPAGFLAAADVFVLGSKKEGISNTILEAMSAGLPVIATDVGGNSELVTPAVGTLVPAEDATAMAAAMHKMAADKQLRGRLSLEARRRAEQEFSVPRMVEAYREVYAGSL